MWRINAGDSNTQDTYAFLGLVGGKSFGKAFRILGLDERKGRWVVKQDFQGSKVNDTSFFCNFLQSPLLNRAHSGNGLKALFTLHKLVDKVVLDC